MEDHESAEQHPTYVVLGATGGIGSTLCRQLAKCGARLMIAGRDEAKLAQKIPALSP